MLPDNFTEDKDFIGGVFKRLSEIWDFTSKYSWRFILEFIKVIPLLQNYFKEFKFNEHFLDEFLLIIKDGNYQLKREAALGFCQLLRQNTNSKKRETYFVKLLHLKNSKSCYERGSFIECARALIQTHSLQFIMIHDIIGKLIPFVDDQVSIIRIRIIKVFVEIASKTTNDIQKIIFEKIKHSH